MNPMLKRTIYITAVLGLVFLIDPGFPDEEPPFRFVRYLSGLINLPGGILTVGFSMLFMHQGAHGGEGLLKLTPFASWGVYMLAAWGHLRLTAKTKA
jgi:hypothetical protein